MLLDATGHGHKQRERMDLQNDSIVLSGRVGHKREISGQLLVCHGPCSMYERRVGGLASNEKATDEVKI